MIDLLETPLSSVKIRWIILSGWLLLLPLSRSQPPPPQLLLLLLLVLLLLMLLLQLRDDALLQLR